MILCSEYSNTLATRLGRQRFSYIRPNGVVGWGEHTSKRCNGRGNISPNGVMGGGYGKMNKSYYQIDQIHNTFIAWVNAVIIS